MLLFHCKMSTIDVVEETSIFQSFQAPISNSTNPIEYEPQEIMWLVVLLSSVLYLAYTFLKRKS